MIRNCVEQSGWPGEPEEVDFERSTLDARRDMVNVVQGAEFSATVDEFDMAKRLLKEAEDCAEAVEEVRCA